MSESARILIVEGSQTQALRLSLLMEEQGWQPCWCPTPESALADVRERLPDLMIIDYFLPRMSGAELCRHVRSIAGAEHVPVLMLAPEDAELNGARQALGSTTDVVRKSDDPTGLLLRIRTLLEASSASGRSGEAFQPPSILVIDDSLTYLEHLANTLAKEGYEVAKANNGAKGLRLLGQRRFDCVLVDLVMPEIDGIEVCRRVSAMRPGMVEPVSIIMLTARENQEDLTLGLSAGADDFVGKSSDLTVLCARLRAVIRRKVYERENRRIREELKAKQLEALRARAEKEAAEALAAMAKELAEANQELESTNRKLRETQVHLVQTEKMASLGQLVAGIAHEINNPLAFVLNNLETVQSIIDRLTPEIEPHLGETSRRSLQKANTRLEQMREGLERVKQLVLGLRTFSRLDESEFKTIDIHESIDSVLLFLRHRMEPRIRLQKNYGIPGPVSCYAGRLNQVLMNLVANAIESIEGEGTITITTGQQSEHFFISVKDTGKGIPEEIQHRIFEPFFTTKPVGQGTGLGLAISYSIVQDHQGRIEVHSEEGRGTEFVVTIPLHFVPKAKQ